MTVALSMNFLLNQLRDYAGTLAGGHIEFYSPGSTSLNTVWLDKDMTQIAQNPFPISADGNAELFGLGYYRIVVKNANGVIVYDWNDIEFNSASNVATGGGDPGTPPSTSAIKYTVYTTTIADVPVALDTTVTDQYVVRKGDNNWNLVVTPPSGWSFYGGMAERRLYADGEVMHFLLLNNLIYVVA